MKKIVIVFLSVLLFLSILAIPRAVEAVQCKMNIPGSRNLENGYAENWYRIADGKIKLYVEAGHTGNNNYVVGSVIERNKTTLLSASASKKTTVVKGPYQTSSLHDLSAYCHLSNRCPKLLFIHL